MLIINDDPWYTAPVSTWLAPVPTFVRGDLTPVQQLIDKHVVTAPFETHVMWNQISPHVDGLREAGKKSMYTAYRHNDIGYSKFFTECGFTDMHMFGYTSMISDHPWPKKRLCETLITKALGLAKMNRTSNIAIFPIWRGLDFNEYMSWAMSELKEDIHIHVYRATN